MTTTCIDLFDASATFFMSATCRCRHASTQDKHDVPKERAGQLGHAKGGGGGGTKMLVAVG